MAAGGVGFPAPPAAFPCAYGAGRDGAVRALQAAVAVRWTAVTRTGRPCPIVVMTWTNGDAAMTGDSALELR